MSSREESPRRKVVVLGGGTGIFPCLEGLKNSNCDVTAVVTVADDGGSSGRLRKDYHIHPPGDIRNCLVALSHADPLLRELISYRFEDSMLKGHSFGNLLIAVLTRLTGDFRRAIEETRRILGVEGRVIPSTATRVVLVAAHPDGTKSTGEQSISRSGKPIVGMELRPEPPPVSEEIEAAIAEADLVVVGPGSLYTSIVPNLLVPGMARALYRTKALVTLAANLMSQPGESDALDLGVHIRTLFDIGGLRRLDVALVNSDPVPEEVLFRYQKTGAEPVVAREAGEWLRGAELVRAPLLSLCENGKVRHDGKRLCEVLLQLAEAHQHGDTGNA